MSEAPADPRCPECGEPIGVRATYCMHCSADLTEERAAADVDEDGAWDRGEARSTTGSTGPRFSQTGRETEQLLDPDGLVDNTLTVVVGIAGGLVVGFVGTVALLLASESGWALPIGILAWLGATSYLVRRRTVQAAVARSGYAVAVVLLLVPVVAFSPLASVDGGLDERFSLFLALVFFVVLPAGTAAAIGWIASRFVPDDARGADG